MKSREDASSDLRCKLARFAKPREGFCMKHNRHRVTSQLTTDTSFTLPRSSRKEWVIILINQSFNQSNKCGRGRKESVCVRTNVCTCEKRKTGIKIFKCLGLFAEGVGFPNTHRQGRRPWNTTGPFLFGLFQYLRNNIYISFQFLFRQKKGEGEKPNFRKVKSTF